MKRLLVILLILTLAFSGSACHTIHHTVGRGAAGGEIVQQGAWYALWGLVPISVPNVKDVAGTAVNYRATTEFTVPDIIISFFTSIVSIQKKTIRVEK